MAAFRSTRTLALALGLLAAQGALRAATDRPMRSIVADPKAASGSPDATFVVSGDSRPTITGAPLPRILRTLAGEIGLIRPDFALWTGDMIYGYNDTPEELRSEYAGFLALFEEAGVPVFDCAGNHEIHSDEDEPCDPKGRAPEEEFERRFGHLYGSFDYGDLHFILLDTALRCDPDRIGGEQLAWLKRDLEANRSARMIFVFTHTEMFSSPQLDEAQREGHLPIANRDELHALFTRYPVRAVFSGHEHLFWREQHDGIQYFVTGGGGAPLYASPDRQGISNYLIVTVSGANVVYDVIEPGRLFQEDAATGGRDGASSWLVNTNDSDVVVRGARLRIPAKGRSCDQAAPEAHVTSWDRKVTPIEIRKTSCLPRGGGLEIVVSLKVPKGKSVEVSIPRPAAAGR